MFRFAQHDKKSILRNFSKFNNKVFTAELNQQTPSGAYLKAVVFYNENGVVITSVKDKSQQPEKFFLSQNYPNPFNSKTKIDFTIPYESQVEIELLNILGQKVLTIIDELKPAGNHFVLINSEGSFGGDRLSSGIYFLKMRAGEYSNFKKLTLLK